MRKNSNGVLATIIMLLFIVVSSFGIYELSKYVIGDTEPSSSQEQKNAFEEVGLVIYVNDNKVGTTPYTHTVLELNEYVTIDFKSIETGNYINRPIVPVMTNAAKNVLEVEDVFNDGSYVRTRVKMVENAVSATVYFTDNDNSFIFEMVIELQINPVTDISINDTTIWRTK